MALGHIWQTMLARAPFTSEDPTCVMAWLSVDKDLDAVEDGACAPCPLDHPSNTSAGARGELQHHAGPQCLCC